MTTTELPSRTLMPALLQCAGELIRRAVIDNTPGAVGRQARDLYRDNSENTAAVQAALLSCYHDWDSLAAHFTDRAVDSELDLEGLAILFIRRTHNQMRRRIRQSDRLADQVARGQRHGIDGELRSFDPADYRETEEMLKNIPEEIALWMKGRSERDRLVVFLWLYEGMTYEEIVSHVKAELPNPRISIATACRVLKNFQDAMRARLSTE